MQKILISLIGTIRMSNWFVNLLYAYIIIISNIWHSNKPFVPLFYGVPIMAREKREIK